MELIKEDLEHISEDKLKELQRICLWINNEPDSEAYTLREKNNDVKSVFVLKRFGEEISTTKEMSFGTKQNERNKGYAGKGFDILINLLKKRKDIKEVYIFPLNYLTANITLKYDFKNDGGAMVFENNNFDINYDHLCEIIKSGDYTEEDILKLCNYQQDMLNVAKNWIKVKNNQSRYNL